MPYDSVDSLPPTVRSRLRGKKLRQWMHVWNSEYAAHGDESRAFGSAWSAVRKEISKMQIAQHAPTPFTLWMPFAKVDEARRTVSGYATTPDRDLDGEIITLDAVKAALPDYMAWGNIREMHTNRAVGVADATKTRMDTTGLWLTAKIVDDDAWKKCVEKVYKGFSIGGRKEAVAEADPSTITAIKLVEISIVDRPANPSCRFDVNKRAKPGGVAHLVKTIVSRTPAQRAMKKMAQAVMEMTKDGPPAAHDGFSLPAKTAEPAIEKDNSPCEAHGKVNCPECVDKRDMAPVKTKASKKDKKIQKAAKRAAKKSVRAALVRSLESVSLPLLATGTDGLVKSGHELDLEGGEGGLPATFFTLKKRKTKAERQADEFTKQLEDFIMNQKQNQAAPGPDLEAVLAKVMAKAGARAPSRAQRMMRATTDLKKARKAAKDMEECMKALASMHRAAYLAKQASVAISKAGGKKPKPDDDEDDGFNHQDAMEKLQKAYGSLSMVKTMMKSARVNIAKAAGRSGQRGQEVGDSEPGYYEVPMGVKDISPSQMARLGPAGGASGSEPPIQAIDVEWKTAGERRAANAIAKGYVSREAVDAMVRAAAAEAKVEVLEKLPAVGGGRRPVLWDTRQLGVEPSRAAALMKDVDQVGLYSDDESARKSAVGTLIGNMVFNGAGKSVLDPDFRGRGGI